MPLTEAQLRQRREAGRKGGKAKVPKGFAKNRELAVLMGKTSRAKKGENHEPESN